MTESIASATPSPLRRGFPFALVLLILINLYNYLDRTTMAAVALPVQTELNVSNAAIGSLVTGFLITYMILAPLFGWWADRVSRWKLIGLSLIIQSLASGGSGMASTFAMLMAMRCVVGIGEAAYGPAAPALLSDMYPPEKRGRILALFYAAIPVGSALGYAIGGQMRELTGDWRWAFYVLMPPGLILGLICFFMRDPESSVVAQGSGPLQRPGWRDYTQFARIPSYIINSIGMTLMTFAIGGISQWMPKYLEVDRGVSTTGSTVFFGLISAGAGIAGTLAGGMVGDKLRSRFPGSYFHVSGAGMLLGFPLFLLFMITPFPLAWVVLFLGVFCLFLNTGPGNTILANVVPANVRGAAFALNIFIIHLFGDAISPALIGIIADSAKTPTSTGLGTGFVLVSILMAIGGAIWWTGARFLERDTRRANPSEQQGIDLNLAPSESSPKAAL